MLIYNANGPSGYRIANSLRFRSSASAYLNRTPGSAGNRKTWTFSAWVKRGALGSAITLFAARTGVGATYSIFRFGADTLVFEDNTITALTTASVYRDTSAWYHIVLTIDTTQATAANRTILYVNGVQATWSTGTYPTQNANLEVNSTNTHLLGQQASGQYFDGYLTEVNFIDGQALTPSSFGEIDAVTGVWKPKAYSGTYGTNGFRLNFSNGTSTTTLGNDSSGNGNNWTTNNISLTAGSTYDWMIDSPTPYAGSSYGVGNYCTLNPLVPSASALSNGNLTSAGSTVYPTIQPTSGNWYFEINGVAKNWTPPAAFPTGTGDFNFGQRPFANTPTSGFKSLCTYNLPTPSIVNGASYMAATTYTGTGSSLSVSNAVNSISFQPDFVWIKSRSAATDHALYDVIRGTQNRLESNTTDAAVAADNGLTAFGSAGFTVNTLAQVNTNAATYVGWQWKAGGTAVSNTNGSITSSVSASALSGFSVVTYTGTGVAGTIGHGLGVTPAFIITKSRSDATTQWVTWHKDLSGAFSATCAYIYLNSTAAASTTTIFYNGTQINSSTIGLQGTGTSINNTGSTYVAYCFAAIAGYSAFGSFSGNASTNGTFVYTGFLPKVVLIKCSSGTGNWFMLDSSRNTYNVVNNQLYPNLPNAESATTTLDILSNGFKMRTSSDPNASATYVYAAWASSPFTNSLAY